MQIINSIKKKKKVTRVALAITTAILLFITGSISNTLNSFTTNSFIKLTGEAHLDSNIVIIHITENDIQKFGGWPLRRSYYALLIKQLTKLQAKKIGIEVLLTANSNNQSLYDDLLNAEIKESGIVVVSSVIVENRSINNAALRDSIIFSQPKLKIPSLASGHINYMVDNGILVPAILGTDTLHEKAFSAALADLQDAGNQPMKINFYSSWKRFENYSLLDLFKMVEENDPKLQDIKGKIVLIGVSDPSIAKTISTPFDNELPGVALHAFALDNILTHRSIDRKFSSLITGSFFLILIILIVVKTRFPFYKILTVKLIFFTIVSFLFFSLFNIEINYSFIILPLFILLITEFGFILSENKRQLSRTLSESDLLKKALYAKETELENLQSELKSSAESFKDELTAKINLLKEEVLRLKKSNEDNEPIQQEFIEDEIRYFEGIIYKSTIMHNIVTTINKIAKTDATVLILGESGSGKELVARAIHNLSDRRNNNFVAVNCAALPESLLESELFGHVKGAFTNAVADKKGRFELADDGTIFLDEIGETSENFQVKLLRVIQFGEFEKVGSSVTHHVNLRIIAATNKKIEMLVNQNKFREDLYYRLNVIKIQIPSLNERKEDIEPIALHFAKRENPDMKLSKGVLESLLNIEWKGNVRELESVIKRAIIFAGSNNRKIVYLEDLSEEYRILDRTKIEDIILQSLRNKTFSHSSINETAKELGNLSRTLISENLRGIFFQSFVKNSFNMDAAVKEISATEEKEILDRVQSKCTTYIENIKKDLVGFNTYSFDEIKGRFNSKYKNLPSKYHPFLDQTIRFLISNLPEEKLPGK